MQATVEGTTAARTAIPGSNDLALALDNGSAAIRRLVGVCREVLHCEGVVVLLYGEQGDPMLYAEPALVGDLGRILVSHVDSQTPAGTVLALDRAGIGLSTGNPVRRAELRPLRSATGSLAGVLAILSSSDGVYLPRGGDLMERLAGVFEDHLNLMRIGVRDYLTGLYNRRFFDEMASREWRRARRDTLPISVLIADVDHFKAYNDVEGHPAGDQALRSVARCLSETFRRAADVLARYGGEEFGAILPKTDREGGRRAAERLCESVAALRIPHTASRTGFLTISVGVATANEEPMGGSGLSVLIQSADEALYRAKHAGRARVEVAEG